jgi:hemolysin D
MNNTGESQQSLISDLQEYSPEGIEILYAEPSSIIRWTILVLVGLLVSAVVWSFFARADVIVSAGGVLVPAEEARRVYSPVEGEIDELLIREDEPVVQAGERIAVLRSRRAAEYLANARQAEIQLRDIELKLKLFEAERNLERRQIEVKRSQVKTREEQLDRVLTSGSEQLRADQMARLTAARSKLATARSERDEAKERYENMRPLAGRGLAEVDVERQRLTYEAAREAYRTASDELSAMELQFISETASNQEQLIEQQLELERLRIELDTDQLSLEQREAELDAKHAMARAAVETARQTQVDTEDGGLIVLLAPVSGVVMNLSYSQAGDKVQADTPLLSIAPQTSRKVLEIDVAEKDRGLLVEGSPVKLKFNAFPYQQYGVVEGTLEFISPTTRLSDPARPPTYRARVSLAEESIEVDGQPRPLRYGMQATAEIVVGERPVIDMVLDPIRGT